MGSESPEGDHLTLFFQSNNSEHVKFEIFCLLFNISIELKAFLHYVII